jgi:hypothetical protein
MATPEALKQRIPELRFAPEGYVSDTGIEFYEQFVAMLKANGFNTDTLLYCGIDAKQLLGEDGSVIPSDLGIFAMNETGWLGAIRAHDSTPALYSDKEGGKDPCIALYDRSQLAHAKDYDVAMKDAEDYDSPVKPTNIVPGKKLEDSPLDERVDELVIHRDFPNAHPSDALVAVVHLEEENYNPHEEFGF